MTSRGGLGAEEDGGCGGGEEVFGTGDPSPTRGREVGRIRRKVEQAGEMLLHTSSVKNQRFLTASPQGEALGAVEEREVIYAASQRPLIRHGVRRDTFPSRGRLWGAERIRREVVRIGEMLLHTSSVKNQRFLTASPQGEALGAVEEREVTTSPSKIKDFCHLPYKGRQGALPRRCNNGYCV